MDPIQVTIFHTNDMHARLEAMARLSAFARRRREEAASQGRQVFFWDAGDAADRRVRVCSATKGAAFSPILNAMGYTLQTMGNAISLTYGPQAMAEVARRADFPILAANLRDGNGPLVEGLQEYILLPITAGVKLGVIGLTAPWENIYELFGLRVPNFVEVARRLVNQVRQAAARPVIVLSHLGIEDDRRLADALPEIDLIIGAHSHTRLPEGEERNGVLIAQAGEYAGALGQVDLALNPQTGQVLARSARLLDVPDDTPPDPAFLAVLAAAEQEVDALMALPVGTLEGPLDLDHFHECGIGNLAADALRERMGADAAVVAGGQFHQGLPAGTVTFGQLDAACFSTANPAVTPVRGAQIKTALERGLDPAISEFKMRGLRGTPMGIPQISGLEVEYDPGAEPGQRVKCVWVEGEPLAEDRIYRLAHTDAETYQESGYLVFDEGQEPHYEVPTILREVIQDYLARHTPTPVPHMRRWKAAL